VGLGQGLQADPNEETRAQLPEWLIFEGTREQYLGGLPDRLRSLHPPESWHLDWQRLSRTGNLEAQFALFRDYASHADRFPAIADYDREYQPPALVLRGTATRTSTSTTCSPTSARLRRSRPTSTTSGTFCSRPTAPRRPS
jgi:hypothetical protein